MKTVQKIPVRKINFNYPKDLPIHWFRDNPVATHVSNSFHLIFPDGERFFIRSVKRFADELRDPGLRERVKGFIGQEIQHGKQHEQFFDILRGQGFNIDWFLELHNQVSYEILEPFVSRVTNGKLPLSMTAAAEHYTAAFAEVALDNPLLDELDPSLRDLLRWHAAEELEHRSVAFDVLREVDDSYILRISGLLITSFFFFMFTIMGTVGFMLQDRELTLDKLLSGGALFFSSSTNPLAVALGNILDYFRPDFHPDQKDNLYLVERLLDEKGFRETGS